MIDRISLNVDAACPFFPKRSTATARQRSALAKWKDCTEGACKGWGEYREGMQGVSVG
jgi:hypothetical protein